MKWYLLNMNSEYTIFKVDDSLVQRFEQDHPDNRIAQGNSLQELILSIEQQQLSLNLITQISYERTKQQQNDHQRPVIRKGGLG